MTEKSDSTRRSILPWVSLATLVASAIVVATAPTISDRLLDPDFCRQFGPDASFVEGITALVAPVLVAFLTWLAFYVFVFRPRGPFWKALVALPIMTFIVFAIGVIAHLCFYAPGLQRQIAQVQALQAREHASVTAIRARLTADLGDNLVRGMPSFQNVADIVQQLDRIRRTRARIMAYEREMFDHLSASQSYLSHLHILDGPKQSGLAYYQRLLAPNSNTRRHFELTYQTLDRQEAFLGFLRSHPNSWFVSNHGLVFNDVGVLSQAQQKEQGLENIIDELNHLEGSMGIDTEPERLGPSSRQ